MDTNISTYNLEEGRNKTPKPKVPVKRGYNPRPKKPTGKPIITPPPPPKKNK